ncbi:MAG: hypothetical protein COA63_006180 [Methylophaga sp.]|nr:hypothetical protein [Methylophaga sp.]
MKRIYIFLLLSILSPITLSDEGIALDLFINGCQSYSSNIDLNTNTKDQLGIGYCIGLVEGVSRTIYYYNSKQVCFPEPTPSLKNLINDVLTYIHEHPRKVEKLSGLGVFTINDLVHISLMSTYPCT